MSGYLLGWASGGSVDENTAAAVLGILDIDPSWVGQVDEIRIGGLFGQSISVDFSTFQVTTTGALNYEDTPTENLTVAFLLGGNPVSTESLILTVSDVAEAPDGLTLGGSAIDENSVAGTVVANLAGHDPEGGALTYALISGAGFVVVGQELQVAGGLDHEANASVDVTISVTDAQSHTSAFNRTITIADINEAPLVLPYLGVTSTTIGENAQAGREVGRVVVADPDLLDRVTLSLTGPDAAMFVLDGVRLRLAQGAPLDHASAPMLHVGVLGTDQGGLTADQAFTIQVVGTVSQASSLQAVLGGNGSTLGLTVALTDEGPVLSLGGGRIVLAGQQSLLTADGELSFGAETTLAQLERLSLGIAGRHATGMERMAITDQISRGATQVEHAQTLLQGTDFTG